MIDDDVIVSGAAATTITNARSQGGFLVWKINENNRTIFDYTDVAAGESIGLDFSSGNLGTISTGGNLTNGLRGKEVMFTNYSVIGTISDNTTNPIRHIRATNEDKHIRWIGQPADHTPYVGVFGIRVQSQVNTLARCNQGFRYGIEFSFIELDGTGGGKIGFHIKSDITATTGDRRSSENSGSQDYNMEFIQIHHCYIHDVEGEGVYIGGGFYAGGGTVSLANRFYHDIEYARVENNIVIDTGWDGIQMKNVVNEGYLKYNYVDRTGILAGAPNSQRFGIFVADGFVGEIAYNWVQDAGRTGMRIYDSGLTFAHDNVIVSAGNEGSYGARVAEPVWNQNGSTGTLLVNTDIPNEVYHTAPTTSYTSRPDLANSDLYLRVFNNTFVNCANTLALYTDTPTDSVRVQNNLFINSGSTSITSVGTTTGNVILTGQTLTDIFVDPNNFDYRIKAGSVAEGAGVDISSIFTQPDYSGTARTTTDVGAFEVGTPANQDRYNFVLNSPGDGNIPPTIEVESNVELMLPTSSVTITATANDLDGTITTILWEQISGPSATLTDENTLSVTISDLVEGSYAFTITVTDNLGATDQEQVNVEVIPAQFTYHNFYQADDNIGTGSVLIHSTTDADWPVPTGLNKWFRRGSIPLAKTGIKNGSEFFTSWVNVP